MACNTEGWVTGVLGISLVIKAYQTDNLLPGSYHSTAALLPPARQNGLLQAKNRAVGAGTIIEYRV